MAIANKDLAAAGDQRLIDILARLSPGDRDYVISKLAIPRWRARRAEVDLRDSRLRTFANAYLPGMPASEQACSILARLDRMNYYSLSSSIDCSPRDDVDRALKSVVTSGPGRFPASPEYVAKILGKKVRSER